jgi:hypothetical protein
LTVVPIVSGSVRTEGYWTRPLKPPKAGQGKEGRRDGEGGSGGGGKDGEKAEGEYGAGQVALQGELRGQGMDYVRNDPDGKRMRLDAGVVLE